MGQYLAPELVTSAGHGMAVDWWALGVLVYELLSGAAPFTGATSMRVYQRILAGRVSFPAGMRASAKELIGKLLVANPARRLGSGDPSAIRSDPFFRMFDFGRLEEKKYDAPWKPKLKHKSDAVYFEGVKELETDEDHDSFKRRFDASFMKDVERLDKQFSQL